MCFTFLIFMESLYLEQRDRRDRMNLNPVELEELVEEVDRLSVK